MKLATSCVLVLATIGGMVAAGTRLSGVLYAGPAWAEAAGEGELLPTPAAAAAPVPAGLEQVGDGTWSAPLGSVIVVPILDREGGNPASLKVWFGYDGTGQCVTVLFQMVDNDGTPLNAVGAAIRPGTPRLEATRLFVN